MKNLNEFEELNEAKKTMVYVVLPMSFKKYADDIPKNKAIAFKNYEDAKIYANSLEENPVVMKIELK
tara:strand:+ start:2094 stop:2294 length:201 start_codon:yes stop_codon:yes gene_type:complete